MTIIKQGAGYAHSAGNIDYSATSGCRAQPGGDAGISTGCHLEFPFQARGCCKGCLAAEGLHARSGGVP